MRFLACTLAATAPPVSYGATSVGKNFLMGVNLGGWLVRENWIFPDEMPPGIDDEWTLIKRLGGPNSEKAKNFMHEHWKSFVTDDDLDALKDFGITHVRIPVGWWLVDYNAADGFVDGGKQHLERVLNALQARNMGAFLDLHALPGAQAHDQCFTGKREKTARFFEEEQMHSRGVRAMVKLAEYIKSMENIPERDSVVRGMELVNEPDVDYTEQTRALYLRMVPQIRQILKPADRYAILLSFMDPPAQSGPWLTQQIAQGPAHIWFNVIYDRHLYHAYGDDDGAYPWTNNMDSCKTCCRDRAVLQGLGGVPFIVGEWSLTTGTRSKQEHIAPAFLRSFWAEQVSLWKNSGALGSFFWLHRLKARKGQPSYFVPFNLLGLIYGPANLTKPMHLDLSRVCPGKDLSKCPSFDPHSDMTASMPCEWQGQAQFV